MRWMGPVAVALALLTAACTSSPAPSRGTADGAGLVGEGIVDLPLGESLDVFLRSPNATHAALLATAMGEDGDRRWVPYLVDLLRLGWSEDATVSAEVALAAITDLPRPDDAVAAYVTYGTWMRSEGVDPGPEYLRWKPAVYRLVDPAIAELLAQVDDPVLAAGLQWGGVPRGGIPELNAPAVQPASAPGPWVDDEIVFGADVDGRRRAYPLRILGHHELANDVLAGRPVALAYCSLCRSAVLFDRRVGGRVLDFQTSGLLLDANKVMVDRQTGTLWRQLTGEALAGPLIGHRLEQLPVVVTRWGRWRGEHPDGDVLAVPERPIFFREGQGSATYSYQPGDAYREYYGSQELWFPVLSTPPVFPLKAEVATLELGGEALAVDVAALAQAGAVVLRVGGSTVVAVATDGGARFYQGGDDLPTAPDGRVRDRAGWEAGEDGLGLPGGRQLARLTSGQSYWFAWYGSHPDTRWWPQG